MTRDELFSLKEDLSLLAEATDPQTRYKVDDTILKSSYNKRTLLKAVSLIDILLTVDYIPSAKDRGKEHAFYLTEDQKRSVRITETPISISAFTYSINAVINKEKMKGIKATQITSWLMSQGYLTQKESTDGERYKTLSETSASIGISAEERTTENGRVYQVNLYNKIAQLFIIDHLNEICQYSVNLNSPDLIIQANH